MARRLGAGLSSPRFNTGFGIATEAIDLKPLLASIIRHGCEILDCRQGCIGLYEKENRAIRIAATRGMARGRVGGVIASGAGIAGRVIETRKLVIEENYTQIPGAWPEVAGDHVLGVPILRGRRLLGFFAVVLTPPRLPEPRDIALVTRFARHAAIAISNAQSFEREQRKAERLSLITRVSRVIAAGIELDRLLKRTAVAIHKVLGYPSVALGLVEPRTPDRFLVRAIAGTCGAVRAGSYRQGISEGIAGAAIAEKAIQQVADVRRDPRYIRAPGMHRTRAELAVPILLGGEPLGVINVEGPSPFSAEDAETLQLVAQHLAPAIHNAALFERERLRTRRLSLISRIGQIATTGLNRLDLLQRSADAIHELLGYANVDIPMLDADQPDILVFGARGGEHKKIKLTDRLHTSQGIIGAAARSGRTQLVNNVAADPRYVVPPLNAHNRAEVAVPIAQGGKVLGVLNVEGPGPFDHDDVESLKVVADHLAVAVLNSELHEKARREAVQSERQRLSRDLHDSVSQLLFSLSLLAQSLPPAWRRSPDEGERKATRVVELAGAALREMRVLVGALYPAEGDGPLSEGDSSRPPLPLKLRDLVREWPEEGPKVSFRSRAWQPQPADLESVIYRVSQEALTNALKHSRAREVVVLLSANRRHVCVTVTDDGAGFRRRLPLPRVSRSEGGLGLGIMEARVLELAGRLQIRSSPGRGTQVHARFARA